jgi:hypothetical protein
VRSLFEKGLAGRREAVLHAADLVTLSMRLGMHLDLWSIQNALWSVVRSGGWPHDPESLGKLAHALWFDQAVVLGRSEACLERATA